MRKKGESVYAEIERRRGEKGEGRRGLKKNKGVVLMQTSRRKARKKQLKELELGTKLERSNSSAEIPRKCKQTQHEDKRPDNEPPDETHVMRTEILVIVCRQSMYVGDDRR